VHLFNDVNTTAGHALPNDDVPLREETIPISGIKLRFNESNITGFHLEPEGLPLKPKKVGGALEVEVPPVAIHEMVVADIRSN
jgi:hypothetical protein